MRIFRAVPAALALAAVATLTVACSTAPGASVPTSTGQPSGTSTPPISADASEVEVAWLDGGRAIAVLTWGSSSCAPALGDVKASGQSIRVTLAASGEKACTDDLVPRGLMVPVPEGVDVTAGVEVDVVHGERTAAADLDALAEAPHTPTEFAPSASRFGDDGIVLLTWGSGSCAPVVNEVGPTDAGARVVFREIDGVCTMDMAPRLTPIVLPEPAGEGPFELTLVGGGLDGKVAVEN